EYLGFEGAYHRVPEIAAGAIKLNSLVSRRGTVLEENESARLIDLGDGVALLEFRSKMNTLGVGVLTMVERSLERVERDGFDGLVLGNDDARAFSAGANLAEAGEAMQSRGWKAVEEHVKR